MSMKREDRDAYRLKMKGLADDKLNETYTALVSKTERARVRFSKSRSVRDSEAYAKLREALGVVRTQIVLRRNSVD